MSLALHAHGIGIIDARYTIGSRDGGGGGSSVSSDSLLYRQLPPLPAGLRDVGPVVCVTPAGIGCLFKPARVTLRHSSALAPALLTDARTGAVEAESVAAYEAFEASHPPHMTGEYDEEAERQNQSRGGKRKKKKKKPRRRTST